MANTNSKISTVVSSQLPFFVRNDHPNFVAFLEAYYEYLEQSNTTLQFGKTTERSKNLLGYMDIDNTLDDFSDILFQRFLALIPKDLQADKKLILKNAKDFYRSTGSEKSIRFLMRVLFNEEIEFYYPKSDVLRASDGKWYVEKTLRVTEESINGVANSSTAALEKFISRKITGNTSNASAKVESVSRFFDKNVRVDELVISEVKGVFKAGETIRSYFDEATETKMVTGRVFGGIFNGVKIVNPGTSYVKGTTVPVITTDEDAGGASIVIDKVSTGNISAVTVITNDYGYIDGGAGYRIGDFLAISDPEGLGANAYISSANTDGTYHQNTYNIIYTTIESIANANINNINYGLYFSGFTNPANANTTLANSLSYWVFANAGPARLIVVNEPGAGYISPTIGVFGNTAIKSLGILGRMEIVNGGVGYAVGNQIEFINYPDTYGYAGRGNVTNVAANGRIQQVKFISYGEVPGGLGYSYDQLPVANVISSTGTGANIVVTAIVGTGGSFKEANSVIGRIERLSIVAGGSSYTAQNTSLDMTTTGDGTAVLEPILLEGIITKPGRYINDDGHLSSFNFLQDRDYYQNYSFVLKMKQSISEYKNALRDLVQPAGTKLFGERTYASPIVNSQVSMASSNIALRYYRNGTYKTSATNNVYIYLTAHGFANNNNVYIEFNSGDTANLTNAIFLVRNVTASNVNTFNVKHSNVTTSSGNVTVILMGA
jgi:hypothetical protein